MVRTKSRIEDAMENPRSHRCNEGLIQMK